MAGFLFRGDKPLTSKQELVILLMENIILSWKSETGQLM